MSDHEELVTAIIEALDKTSRIDRETHKLHHDYLADTLEARRKRRERWEKVRVQVTSWSVITAIGAALSGLGWIGKVIYDVISGTHK